MDAGFDLQFLKRGKALCSAAFPNLCATWNWLVSALSNLKGDHDVNSDDGHITVDWASASHPVIRCTGCKAADADETSTSETMKTAWRLELDAYGNGTLYDCLINMGGSSFYEYSISPGVTSETAGYVCAVYQFASGAVYEDGHISAKVYDSLSAVQEAQKEEGNYVVPLYKRDTVNDEWIALRTSVQVQVFEVFE